MSGVGEHLRESKDAIADVFRNRSLRRLNLALAGSVMGDWAYSVAMAVYAYERGGATVVGIIGVVRYVSMALLAPVVSLLADRFDRRKVMIAADVVRGVLVGAVAVMIATDGPALPVYALTIGVGWVGLAFRPAQSALLPSLASTPSELTAANVAANTIHSVGFFVGPAVAGLLLAVADIGAVVVFDALTFLWSAVMVLGLHPRADEAGPDPGVMSDTPDTPDAPDSSVENEVRTGMFAGVGDGYRTIFASHDLRLLVTLYAAQTVVAGASVVYEVAIALDLLGLAESGVGVLNAALGVGGILGGVVALLLSRRGKLARDFGIGVSLWALPLLLIAAWPTLATAILAMVLIGLGNSVVDVNVETIVQRLVPDQVMGRVFGALDSAAIGGMALGAAAMPLLMATVGLRAGLVMIGLGVATVVAVSIHGLRRIDRIALAPQGLASLQAVPMLAVLPEFMIERLARLSEEVRVPSGTAVFHEGDAGDRFYIVESGTADVTIRGRLVASLAVGESFGEIALLRDVPRTATVTATSDLMLRAIGRRHFLPAVTGHTEASEQAELVVGRLMSGS